MCKREINGGLYVLLEFTVLVMCNITVYSVISILAADANSTIGPLLYSMWPSLRGSGYQAD